MKHLTLLGMATLFASACATIVPSNTTVSDDLLNATRGNAKDSIKVVFETELPPEHEVQANEGGPGVVTGINKTFGSMLQSYSASKFNSQDGRDGTVTVRLKSFELKNELPGGAHNIIMAMSSQGAEGTSSARLQYVVTIARKGRAVETKTFTASADRVFNNALSNMSVVYADLTNKACNKALVVLNGYLATQNL